MGRLYAGSISSLLVASLGIIAVVVAGSSNLYWLSRRWGPSMLRQPLVGRLLRLDERRLDQARAWFDRWRVLAIIFGRHLPGFRIAITVIAATMGVPYRIFSPSVAVSTASGAACAAVGLCQDEPMSAPAAGRRLMVSTVDYHTAGEPFRIVSGGVPPLRGRTILEKRRYALDQLDHIRQLLVFEPRGHADMYGGFVTDPQDADGQLGVVFFHNAGYSTACGHGTIALVTWAIDAAMVPAIGPSVEVVVDVPSGRVRTVATLQDGRVRSVRIRNVPSFVLVDGLTVTIGGRRIEVAVAYGGAFYAIVPAERFELPIEPAFVPRFIELGREIKAAIEAGRDIVHPLEPELQGIYGVMFTAGNRNVTVFADGEVDRSPCGSGTSARLALLDQQGELARGTTLMHESVIGSRFASRVVGEDRVGDYPAVVTEIEGSAHLTGYHQFVLAADDPIGLGFLVR